MSDIYKSSYTTPIPERATVKGKVVTWTDKRGKRKTGKLTDTGRVLIETGKWIARWTDETGRTRKESTGCTSKDAALHWLRNREMEVERIRAGLMTREEINKTQQNDVPIDDHLDAFDQSRRATDVTPRQIADVNKKLADFLSSIDVRNLSDVNASHIEQHIVSRKESGISPKTINNDLASFRKFFSWCISSGRLQRSPMKDIRKLSLASGASTDRRAFTEEELSAILEAAKTRGNRSEHRRKEVELIYLTLLGTGLRSSELASIKVAQVTTKHIILEAPNEKNRKGTYQPITRQLSDRLQAWIADTGKKPGDKLFFCSKKSIHDAFVGDCKAAGIRRVDDRNKCSVFRICKFMA